MIIDDVGVKHTKVLNNNLKIISLVPSFTELLWTWIKDQIVAEQIFVFILKTK